MHYTTKTMLLDAERNMSQDTSNNGDFLVKTDIEGGERDVIRGNDGFFSNNKVRLGSCVYHRQDDAIVIKDIVERLGYTTRFSRGCLLIGMNGIHYPYFPHGVIYA